MRLRNWETVFPHAFEMKLDSLMDEMSDFSTAVADRDAARKVRDIRAKARRTLLDDNEILHFNLTSLNPPA